MSIRCHTGYTFEHYEREYDTTHHLPMPFDTEGDPEYVYISANGLRAVLGFLVQDDCPPDPFEEYDEGELVQFDRGRAHYGPRPEIEDFKRIVRANPGQVVTVDAHGDGFRAGELVTPAHCRGDKNSPAERMLDSADGYYIAPDDVTDAWRYAKGSLEKYSAWCEGDVWGVVVWAYTRESIAGSWGDPDRDLECWGFYGYEYASEELQDQFKEEVSK